MTAKQKSDKGPRLDELLVRRGFFASRSRARDAIERATVRVGGVVARKPGAFSPRMQASRSTTPRAPMFRAPR